MAATGIHEVRHPHDAVLDLILAKPWATLRELSLMSGYSPSWLSQMIRSDCFRQEYERRRGDVECGVLGKIEERLQSLTHLAIDRMEDVLVETTDRGEVIDAFDRVLHRAGYAPQSKQQVLPANFQQNNLFVVQKGELEDLRQGMLSQHQPQTGTPLLLENEQC